MYKAIREKEINVVLKTIKKVWEQQPQTPFCLLLLQAARGQSLFTMDDSTLVEHFVDKYNTKGKTEKGGDSMNTDVTRHKDNVKATIKKANRFIDGATHSILQVKHIYYSTQKGKEFVRVIFTDGTKEKVVLHDGDVFDLNIGVALAIAQRIFGTKNQFHKMIKTTAKKVN